MHPCFAQQKVVIIKTKSFPNTLKFIPERLILSVYPDLNPNTDIIPLILLSSSSHPPHPSHPNSGWSPRLNAQQAHLWPGKSPFLSTSLNDL